MHIYITNSQKIIHFDVACIESIVQAILRYMEVECSEISLQFVSKKRITSLHEEFFNDPTPTDCITFPIDPPGPEALLGEVFVCPQTAKEYVDEHGGNIEQEIILYICHGILHLLGFDDREDEDRREMRKNESFLLENLKKDNLLHLTYQKP